MKGTQAAIDRLFRSISDRAGALGHDVSGGWDRAFEEARRGERQHRHGHVVKGFSVDQAARYFCVKWFMETWDRCSVLPETVVLTCDDVLFLRPDTVWSRAVAGAMWTRRGAAGLAWGPSMDDWKIAAEFDYAIRMGAS